MLLLRGITRNALSIMRRGFSVKKFNLPDLGEKIKEGKIQKWYVAEGQSVEEYQKLADITSDKQFTELTASDTGRITKIFHQEGDNCLVGSPLFEIDVKEDEYSHDLAPKDVAAVETHEGGQMQPQKSAAQSRLDSNKLIATPAVRQLIKEHKVDLAEIASTGKDGRVLKEDVLRFIEDRGKSRVIQQSRQAKQPQPPKQDRAPVPPPSKPTEERRRVEMNNFQRGMQKTMTLSNQIPHLSYHEEFDLTELMQMRERSKAFSKEKITYMSYFVKSFSMALSAFPMLNANYDPESPFAYELVDSHNISIAIDTPNGLAVPNIKGVQNLSVTQVQRELNRLRKAAEEARIDRKDLQGGTISISNIGTVGGTYARPLILPPQVAIVALGKTRRLPRFESESSGTVVARNIMSVSFSADHRVIDGGTVANFSNLWKQYLQTPALMLLDLH